ncbi:MAG: DUF4124 domain-containing protein [Luminiphilus sp.]|nr:DUF4124 domain-containing protein [Luminiphilus sp.]
MDRKPTFFHIAASSILLLFLQGQPADASPTYRWVDDNGNPVLSDRPPETGTPYTEVGVDTGFRRYPKPVATETTQPGGQAPTGSASASPRASSNGAEANPTKVVEAHPALCEQAEDNIFKLETFPRMRVRDDDGEVRFMTDEERATQLATAYKVRDANCVAK